MNLKLESPSLFRAEKAHKKAVDKLKRQNAARKEKKSKNKAKTVIVYSGKGGVGKTTTTVNIARSLLSQGFRVAIIDGDVNTPSMSVVFPDPIGTDNLLVCSMGYAPSMFVQSSRVRAFFRDSTKEVLKFAPDYLLIDTPPSITDVHIGLVETMKPGGLILVTQPTDLSWSDVSRTVWFFQSKKIPILGVVRNMVTDTSEEQESPYKILGNIPFDPSFDGKVVYDKNAGEYLNIAQVVHDVSETSLEAKKRQLFDETAIDLRELKKQLMEPGATVRFVNVHTWGVVREVLQSREDRVFAVAPRDRGLDECTVERVSRLVHAFEEDEEAYFMVTKAPATENRLITGEIGKCRMRQHPMYHDIPVVDYHTSKGPITLFPYECIPVTDEMIADNLAHGGKLLNDGRYLPSEESVGALYNQFGEGVGLREKWLQDYTSWLLND